jgi:hypothetical protein
LPKIFPATQKINQPTLSEPVNYFLQNLPAAKTDYPPAAKAPIIAIDKAKPGNSSNPNIKASCPLITFSSY